MDKSVYFAINFYFSSMNDNSNNLEKLSAKDAFAQALILRKEGKLQETVQYLNHAVKLDDSLSLAWYELGNTYGMLHETEKSISAFKQSLESKTCPIETLEKITSSFIELKDYGNARRAIIRLQQLAPEKATLLEAELRKLPPSSPQR